MVSLVNRYYDPARGRFTTPDPFKEAGGGIANPLSWNRYAYTRGDPVNRYDPSGLDDDIPENTSPSGELTMLRMAGGVGGVHLRAALVAEGQFDGSGGDGPDSVFKSVIDLLKKAGDCGGVFGGNIKPWEVAEDMAAGTRFGSIIFDKLNPGVSAQAGQDASSGIYDGSKWTFMRGTITINNRTDGTKYWFGGESTDLNRAKILLHELGHIFNLVMGLGGSQFKDETNPDGSTDIDKEKFNIGLEDKCLKP